MQTHSTATMTARISNDEVILNSMHQSLTRDQLGWLFVLPSNGPKSVVFDVEVLGETDPSSIHAVRSAPEVTPGTFGDWEDWTVQGTSRQSPPMLDGQNFRVEIELHQGSEYVRRGCGYFRIKGEGGGGI